MLERVVGAGRHGDKFFDKGVGQSMVWHPVNGGLYGILHGADGSFDFGDVILGAAYVKVDVGEEWFDVDVFPVAVYVRDGKTPLLVGADVRGDTLAYRWFFAVGYGAA
jgi:hypothetical protein